MAFVKQFELFPPGVSPQIQFYAGTSGPLWLIVGTQTRPFPRGNRLLTTDYIVDMGRPRVPSGATGGHGSGPSRDRKGRTIKWD